MNTLQIKGWMIDAARLPEPLPYYRRLVDFCSRWGFNAILFRLTDDQGSAMRFAAHPEIDTHPHAFTPAELAELAAYASARGIELIPEVESFGHTACITRSPAYAHLLDENQAHPSGFTGLIPNHPDTLALVADLFREVAAVFPSRYLHAGCDEVNWGGSEYSRRQVAQRGRAGVWTEYLNHLNAIARENGKEMMVWADHVLHHEPQILDGLDHSIILVDWNYRDSDPSRSEGGSPGPVEAAARAALERGFCVVGAPAWGWCRWSVRAGASQLRNIDAFADIYRAVDDPRALGVIVTNWVPSRFIQNALWDAPAYAGAALAGGSASARASALARFTGEHYGAAWDARWADMFRTLYEITPPRRGCSADWMAPFQPPAWASLEDLTRLLRGGLPAGGGLARDLPFARLREQIDACAAQVRQNEADFAAFSLAAGYLQHLHDRCALVLDAASDPRPGKAALGQAIARVAERDAAMLAALERDYQSCRFPDDPAASTLLPALRIEDQVLLAARRAAEFTRKLSADSSQLSV